MSKQEKMYRLVSEYRKSGQSVRAFCQERQIKPSTFQYWINKKKHQKASSFISVKKESSYVNEKITLVYPNGVQIRIEHFNLAFISELIKLQ